MGTYYSGKCDFLSACELFVKVLIDNKEICRTSFQSDEDSVNLYKTCISSKIRKSATIRFELWDKDVKYDDMLAKWQKNVAQLSGSENFHDHSATISVYTNWKDEYLEE